MTFAKPWWKVLNHSVLKVIYKILILLKGEKSFWTPTMIIFRIWRRRYRTRGVPEIHFIFFNQILNVTYDIVYPKASQNIKLLLILISESKRRVRTQTKGFRIWPKNTYSVIPSVIVTVKNILQNNIYCCFREEIQVYSLPLKQPRFA